MLLAADAELLILSHRLCTACADPVVMHHASIKTADIHQAVAFYEQLGFKVKTRFTTGATLACWMEGLDGRIELIQVPEPRPALDAFVDEHYTGYYHLSFDLSDRTSSLTQWLQALEHKAQSAGSSISVLLAPQQQQIGDELYEVAFLADTDGLPLEFLRRIEKRAQIDAATDTDSTATDSTAATQANGTQTEIEK